MSVQVKGNKYVIITIYHNKFGIHVFKAREIVEYSQICPVPEAPDFLEGVINLRGSVIPVVDLSRKFFKVKADKTDSTCILITEPTIDNEKIRMGIVVDAVLDVSEIKPEQLEPAPKYGSKISPEYILNSVADENNFILILDIDKVLSHVEIHESFLK